MNHHHTVISMCITIGIYCIFISVSFRYLNDIILIPCHQNLQNLSSPSQRYIDTLIEITRLTIQIEMWNYNYSYSGVYKLENLVMESGGTPVRSVILSTWRSGSSFLGEFVSSVPGSFYYYEPLMMFGIYSQIKVPDSARANNLLKNILSCNYNSEIDFAKHLKFVKNNLKIAKPFGRNKIFWSSCNYKRKLCYDANFTSKICKLFPFQAMKLVRLRLHLFENVLEDKKLNVKVVLLVRDPRGVMLSRRQLKKLCVIGNKTDCAGAAGSVCSDMVMDYEAATNLLEKYPDRLMVLRYEDLAFNLNATIFELAKFLRFEPAKWVFDFLRMHTTVSNSKSEKHYSTFRDTKNVPFKWKQKMKFKEVKKIQDQCRKAMSLWGYELAHNASHLASKQFNPLMSYSINPNTARVPELLRVMFLG